MSNTEELAKIVARLDATAALTAQAAKNLAMEVEEARLLAAEDRIQITRLILLVQRLTRQAADTAASTERLEQTTAHVAEDLAASQERADEAAATPGSGADAALRSARQRIEAATTQPDPVD